MKPRIFMIGLAIILLNVVLGAIGIFALWRLGLGLALVSVVDMVFPQLNAHYVGLTFAHYVGLSLIRAFWGRHGLGLKLVGAVRRPPSPLKGYMVSDFVKIEIESLVAGFCSYLILGLLFRLLVLPLL